MRRALVTGATSFPGLALAERLHREGIETHVLVRPTTDTARLRDFSVHVHDGTAASMQRIVEAARPDVTFHLASLYLRDHRPEDILPLIAANLTLGTQLADALHRGGQGVLVNVGSFAQYWNSVAPRPLSLYGATKEAFETLLAYYADVGLACATLILFDTYGPGDSRRKLVPALMGALTTGEALPLPAEDMTMDLTYRDDIAAALLATGRGLRHDPEAFRSQRFAAMGSRHTIRELVAAFEAAAGREVKKNWGGWALPPRHIAVPWEGPRPPGWTPLVSLAEGLKRTLMEAGHAR